MVGAWACLRSPQSEPIKKVYCKLTLKGTQTEMLRTRRKQKGNSSQWPGPKRTPRNCCGEAGVDGGANTKRLPSLTLSGLSAPSVIQWRSSRSSSRRPGPFLS